MTRQCHLQRIAMLHEFHLRTATETGEWRAETCNLDQVVQVKRHQDLHHLREIVALSCRGETQGIKFH